MFGCIDMGREAQEQQEALIRGIKKRVEQKNEGGQTWSTKRTGQGALM